MDKWEANGSRNEKKMLKPRYPSLFQMNTRVRLTELSRVLGRPATLEDIPDDELDSLAELGFDWVWSLSVWQTGPTAQAIYERGGSDLVRQGLYLDVPAWSYHVFEVQRA